MPSHGQPLASLQSRQVRRALARRDYTNYCEYLFPKAMPRHGYLFARVLEKWIAGEVPRLMVFAPPRHTKSWHCSWAAPSYVIGKFPGQSVMHITAAASLAARFGRRNKNTVNSPDYPWSHECQIKQGMASRTDWETTTGSEYLSLGIGGHPVGRPANWLFIDDPVQGADRADSEAHRDQTWDLYVDDVLTRLEGESPRQLITLTRWHQDDPPGRILPEGFDGRSGWYKDRVTSEPWYVLSLPAQAEHTNDPLRRAPGEWLWPEVYGEKRLGPIRARGGRTWTSLYQQRPAPADGLMFKAEDLRWYQDQPPLDTLTIYGMSDYAVTEDGTSADPDWTVHMVVGVDPAWNIYVLDMWRERTTPDIWIDALVGLIRKWRPLKWIEEAGQINKAVGPYIALAMRRSGVFCARSQVQPGSRSKAQRAQAILGFVAEHKLYLPRSHGWARTIEYELTRFPVAKHDDTVDPLAYLGLELATMIEGQRPPEPEDFGPPERPTYDDWMKQVEPLLDRRE